MEGLRRYAWICLGILLLQGCSGDMAPQKRPASIAGVIRPSEDGDAVARHLQSRYDQVIPNCDNNASSPSFLCSGLLLRATEYSDKYHSWQPNPATAAWGVSFSWSRKDSDFKDTHGTSNGFIVYPEKFALSNGLVPVEVECLYPQDAWTSGPDRCTSHAYSSGAPAPTIPLCQDIGVYKSDDWLKKGFFDNENQCAFDVRPARTSRATVVMHSLEIRRLSSAQLGYRRNEIIVADWSKTPDARFPIEAFFYKPDSLPGKPTPLSSAQSDQCDFWRTVKKWIPIIRWEGTAAPSGSAKFLYRVQDQKTPDSCGVPPPDSGADVARHLQSRYDDTAQTCPDQPRKALMSCSGVLMRPGWVGNIWQPIEADKVSGVGIDWVRQDSNATSLRSYVGIVFFPEKYIRPPQKNVIVAACAYPDMSPSDGLSWRCGTVCQKQSPPVKDAAGWVNRFTGDRNQCAFSMDDGDPAYLWQQMMIVRQIRRFNRPADIIVNAWSAKDVEVPVEAIYWTTRDPESLQKARAIQEMYKNHTSLRIPVIRVEMAATLPQRITFSYHEADQGVSP